MEMEFQVNNKQELISCINKLNDKYYKPADKLFKLYEVYSRRYAIPLLRCFRDAHGCIIRAMADVDDTARKDNVSKHLNKYVKILQTLIIFECSAVIRARMDDLLEIDFTPPQKDEIKNRINQKLEKVIKYSLKAFLDYEKNTEEELTKVKDDFKEAFNGIETIYRENILTEENTENVIEQVINLL